MAVWKGSAAQRRGAFVLGPVRWQVLAKWLLRRRPRAAGGAGAWAGIARGAMPRDLAARLMGVSREEGPSADFPL